MENINSSSEEEDITDNFLNETINNSDEDNISDEEINNISDNIFTKDNFNKIIEKEVEKDKRKTTPVLTNYEKVRIIGERYNQIIRGAKPLIKLNTDNLSDYEIVMEEYKNKMIPFKIKRPLPNGTFEIWKFSELQII